MRAIARKCAVLTGILRGRSQTGILRLRCLTRTVGGNGLFLICTDLLQNLCGGLERGAAARAEPRGLFVLASALRAKHVLPP